MLDGRRSGSLISGEAKNIRQVLKPERYVRKQMELMASVKYVLHVGLPVRQPHSHARAKNCRPPHVNKGVEFQNGWYLRTG